jgi:hypothetical protein
MIVVCRKCKSHNVNVFLEQDSAKTKVRGTGILWLIMRLILIFCTCGLWLIIGPRIGTNKTKFNNRKVAICQVCGHKWYIR